MDAVSPIVLSLGGSLVAPPEGIHVHFLQSFRSLILEQIEKGRRFILIVGGGAVCRVYIQAAQDVGEVLSEDMDWLGIHVTRLNAHLLRTIFRSVAHPVIVKDHSRSISWERPMLIGAGWKPGRSTDDGAVRLAKLYGASTVINLTNVERVYDKDPRKCDDAKPFDRISWADFRKIVGTKWSPGLNAPFDPIASAFAQKHGLRVIIAKGTDLQNVRSILDGDPFIGTVIE